MPKIPQYESQLNISTQSAGTRIKSESPVWEAIGDIGESLSKIGESFRKAQALDELTKASIQARGQIEELYSRLEEESDYRNISTLYKENINRIKQEAEKNISLPEAKEEFNRYFEGHRIITETKINNLIRRKMIDEGRANTLKAIEVFKNSYYKGTPQEREIIETELEKLLTANETIGVYSKEETERLRQQIEKDLSEGLVKYDISINPKMALVELQRGEFGRYKKLKEDKRQQLIKEAELALQQKEKQEKIAKIQAINENEDNMLLMLINKDPRLTEDYIKREANLEKIRPEFAIGLINNLKSIARIEAKTKPAIFNKIVEDIIDSTKKEDIKLKLLQKNATGELSDEDFKILSIFSQITTKETIDKFMPKRTWLQRLRDTAKDKELRQQIVVQMFKEYMQRISNGEDPAKVASDITDKALDIHLNEQLKNTSRMIRMIAPDGRLYDVPEQNVSKAEKRGFRRVE